MMYIINYPNIFPSFLRRGQGWLWVILLTLSSCQKDPKIYDSDAPYELVLPEGFPEPIIPEDNQLTVKRVELGKKLFFDPLLSKDSTISCASCHLPEKAFTDGLKLSIGVHGNFTLRNAPTLINVAYLPKLFADGGVLDLEKQVIAPVEDPIEMDFTLIAAAERMKNILDYVELCKIAYDQEPTPYVITRAIAAFERTLIEGNSRFDQYYYQGKNTLNESELNGMKIFFGEKAKCSFCHSGFNFTNNSYYNIGLYEVYTDRGRGRITGKPEDDGKFKVPTLRNITLTAPYMHNGSLATLEEVMEHFISGGKPHLNKDSLIQSFTITTQEKEDLIRFLRCL